MEQLKRLLAACVLAVLCIVPARADFTVLDTNATGFATFNSNTQKVARNEHGTLVSYLKSRNAAYTAQGVVFKLIPPGGPMVEVATATLATNPPCVEASASGEFFAAFPDWTANVLHAYVWRDISASTTPERLTFSLVGDGKFSCAFDESRRTFYYIGLSGTLVQWRVDHGVFYTRKLWAQNINLAQYPSLQVSSDGVLHAFWNTLTGSAPSYRSVQYLVSPDGGNTWMSNWHPAGTANAFLPYPAPPVASDEFGASFRMTRDEDHGANAFMLSAYADSAQIAAVWSFVPGYAERCFVSQKRCSSVFMRYQRKTLARDQIVPIRLGNRVLRPHGGGGLFKRGGRLFFVTTETAELVLARVEGESFVEVSRIAIPDAGPNRCPFELSIFRGSDADDDVIGTFTHLNVSCADWATMPDNAGVTSEVVAFRLPL